MIILSVLPIFFTGFNYLFSILMLSFVFILIFRLKGRSRSK